MQQGLYNFRNTRARQSRSSDSLNERDSSFVQRDIQSSHTDTEETFNEQDSSMGDQDDRNTSSNQENVIFRLLGTLEEGQRMQQEQNMMQQEQNRRMDMMLQLMARKMGINIDDLYVAPEQKIVDSSGGIKTCVEPASYDVGDVGISAESVETCVQSQETTYEALSRDGAAVIVGLGEHEDTIISPTTFVSVEPSNEEFNGINAVVDVFSNEAAHVDDYEFSVAAVNVVPMSIYFDAATPIVGTISMSTYGSPAATSFSMHDGDNMHSSPIYIMWMDTGKKTFHRSSMELPYGDIFTLSAQVLNARLQGLVLMMRVCSWFNFHMDITYWDPGGGWSPLCYLIA